MKVTDAQILEAYAANPTHSQREIAARFGVSQPAISHRLKRLQAAGKLTADPRKRRSVVVVQSVPEMVVAK